MSIRDLGPFDQPVLDYTHNLLQLRLWRREGHFIERNPLIAKLLASSPLRGRIQDKLVAYTKHGRMRRIRRPREPIAGGLRRLAELLSLQPVDVAILQFALALADNRSLRDVAQDGSSFINTSAFGRVLGTILRIPPAEVAAAVGRKGRLLRCGLIESTSGDLDDRLSPKSGLLEVISGGVLTRDNLLEHFLPNVTGGETPWMDHAHLRTEISIACRLLGRAVEQRSPGINLLLYGPTGTGKTELAKRLAREIGVPLYSARGGDDGKRAERMTSLLLGQKIVETGGAMVLFDELEDLFDRSHRSEAIGTIASKETFNRLLEDNPAPIIWTSNHVATVDPAFLRRFSFAIEVKSGGIAQRARVLKHGFGEPIDAPHRVLDRLAERYEVSPAQVVAATRAARLVENDAIAVLEPLLAGTHRLVTGRKARRVESVPEGYVVDAINASIDLDDLATRLGGWRQGTGPGITMCLYGPPGTGKSEYVRFLSRRLQRRLIVKSASDMLSCYVGGTERRIRDAFDEAALDPDAILVFDEVDSLLHDRGASQRSWEVTQVNEMLQQMERFSGILACTTNRWDRLDPAVARRFTFKIELAVPTVDQAMRLFGAMFAEIAATIDPDVLRAELASLRPTPGAFSAVCRRLGALGGGGVFAELRRECGRGVGVRGFSARGA